MLTPEDAWKPLPKEAWNRANARHLASRLGFGISPAFVDRIEKLGPEKAVDTFLGKIRPYTPSSGVIGMQAVIEGYKNELKSTEDQEKRSRLRQKRIKDNREAHVQTAIDWYRFARVVEQSPQEKLVSFFQNVWVVSYRGMKDPFALLDYQQRIRANLGGTYPEMSKSVGLSPAMVRYLDLNQNRKGRPNENFARELFELFTLGEGNYTEKDIQEAARALTGYRLNGKREVLFQPKFHDAGKKTVFGKTRAFTFDDLIDHTFDQPAAARFLPQELVRYYLTEGGLPTALIEPLAEDWRRAEFSIPVLMKRFFTSRIFYDESYQGNMIKSPEHFYFGLLQDLDLDVTPIPRYSYLALRRMGQPYMDPLNVRGWVGGRYWINSATLAARRQFVESSFASLPRQRLNADEIAALENAEARGEDHFTLDPTATMARLKALSASPASFAGHFYVRGESPTLEKLFQAEGISEIKDVPAFKSALLATLMAPEYQLC